MTRREIKAKFDEIVDFAEVEKFLDTPVKRYSSGMYVRLAFAVAAHLEPEILVVDEVLAVGDAAFQKKCLGKMGDVAEKEGRTVLFVSHNMGIISELCHKGLWFTNGKIYGKGETRNLIAKYLSHGVNQSGSILIKEDTDNHQFYFRRLCLIDNKDQISSTFSCQDSIKIKLEYEILKEIQDLEIGFRIVNFSGVNIFTVERSSYLKTALLTGSYMAEIEIPSFFLIPGKYTINIGSYVRNVGFLSFYESLLSFEIEETGSKMALYKGLDFGVVFADLPWKESRLSKS
jgi:lipopolysaccharide transport system ATP-binding protein